MYTSPTLCYCQHMEFPGTVESSEEGGGEQTHEADSELFTEQKMGWVSPDEAVL